MAEELFGNIPQVVWVQYIDAMKEMGINGEFAESTTMTRAAKAKQDETEREVAHYTNLHHILEVSGKCTLITTSNTAELMSQLVFTATNIARLKSLLVLSASAAYYPVYDPVVEPKIYDIYSQAAEDSLTLLRINPDDHKILLIQDLPHIQNKWGVGRESLARLFDDRRKLNLTIVALAQKVASGDLFDHFTN